ncbi:MAG: hypothetical protein ACRELF_18100 [Gemmataceae bacterium]
MPEPFLSPREACRFLLAEFGVKRTPATLAKLRCVGGSPPFRKLNRAVLYSTADLKSWAGAALSIKRRNTSDPGTPEGT